MYKGAAIYITYIRTSACLVLARVQCMLAGRAVRQVGRGGSQVGTAVGMHVVHV